VRRAMQVMAIVVGLGSALIGLSGSLFLAVLALTGQSSGATAPDLNSLLIAAGVVVVGCGLGLPLAWTAARSIRGRPSRAIKWPTVWFCLVLYVLILAAGHSLYMMAPGPVRLILLPGLYVLALLLPVVALIGMVARPLMRRDVDTTWREMLAQTASGAFLGTGLALALEGIVLLVVVLVAAIALSQTVEGQMAIEAMSEILVDPQGVPDLSVLRPLLSSPRVAGLILFGAAVAAPAIEEAVKTLGVALMSYRRPTRGRAFLWGVAGGGGFALAEGLLSATLGLSPESGWVAPIVSRAATTIVHCLAGGLVGLAWQGLIQGPRRWRALLYYLSAVLAHGAWNGLVVSMMLSQLSAPDPVADPIAGAMSEVIASAQSAAYTIALLLLLLGLFLALMLLPRRLARTADPVLDIDKPVFESEAE